jgi:hypothetical protein
MIKIANKLGLGMTRVKHIKKDVLASTPACLSHLPATTEFWNLKLETSHTLNGVPYGVCY